MKCIGIVGSRRRNTHGDFITVLHIFQRIYQEGDVIVSGGCRKGGDKFAELIAAKYNLTEANGKLKIFRAKWNKYGKAAGFIRNTDIAKLSDELIAQVAKDRTGGTEDTIKKFKKFHSKGKIYLC